MENSIRSKIVALTDAAFRLNRNVECPVRHHFTPGMYSREMFIPKGTCIIGKIHRHAHLNTVMSGVIQVTSEFGSGVVHAPCVFTSEPGTQRVLTALEDTVWITHHQNPSNTRDLNIIEQEVIAESYAALETTEDSKCLGS